MTQDAPRLPAAIVRPVNTFGWTLLIPIAALLLSGWLALRSWSERGLVVTVQVDRGYGLRPGDEVRFRGTPVGVVRSVEFAEDLRQIGEVERLRGV